MSGPTCHVTITVRKNFISSFYTFFPLFPLLFSLTLTKPSPIKSIHKHHLKPSIEFMAFYHYEDNCKCDRPAMVVTSWTPTNPARRFICCQNRWVSVGYLFVYTLDTLIVYTFTNPFVLLLDTG